MFRRLLRALQNPTRDSYCLSLIERDESPRNQMPGRRLTAKLTEFWIQMAEQMGDTGFEPVTPSVKKRATTVLIARTNSS